MYSRTVDIRTFERMALWVHPAPQCSRQASSCHYRKCQYPLSDLKRRDWRPAVIRRFHRRYWFEFRRSDWVRPSFVVFSAICCNDSVLTPSKAAQSRPLLWEMLSTAPLVARSARMLSFRRPRTVLLWSFSLSANTHSLGSTPSDTVALAP